VAYPITELRKGKGKEEKKKKKRGERNWREAVGRGRRIAETWRAIIFNPLPRSQREGKKEEKKKGREGEASNLLQFVLIDVLFNKAGYGIMDLVGRKKKKGKGEGEIERFGKTASKRHFIVIAAGTSARRKEERKKERGLRLASQE